MSGGDLIAALPKEMTTGLDTKEFGEIIARYRDSLYPEAVTIDLAAADRVAQTLIVGGLLPGRHQHLRAARHLDREELTLRVRDLTISYGDEPVLEGASVEVGQGQFVSLVGPSGSGKSSLLRAVIGLQKPLAGTVEPERQAVRDRHAVPGRRAAAVEDGARQRRARALTFRGCTQQERAGAGRLLARPPRPCRLRATAIRATSAAASASASRSRRCWR